MAPAPKRKRTVPEEFQFETQCTTTTRFIQAELKWTIEKFGSKCKSKESGEYLTSADFHAPGDEQVKWYLKLYPNGLNEDFSGNCSLFVCPELEKGSKLVTVTFKLYDESNNIELHSETLAPYKFPADGENKGWGRRKIPHNSKLLQVENLVVYCKVKYEIENLEPTVNKFSDLATDIARSFHSRAKDVTFVIGEKKFQAHKFILSARSPVFDAMFQQETEEATLNRCNIVDIQPDVFEALLCFIYTDQVDLTFEMSKNLLAVSKRFQLDLLEWKCQAFLAQNLSINNCCEVLMLADVHGAADLKKDAVNFIRVSSKEVVKTDGWKEMKISRPGLVLGIVDDLLIS